MKILCLLLPLGLLTSHPPKKPAPIALKGYFSCGASLLEKTGEALSYYAATQRNCQQGTVILAYEGRSKQILDTVQVKTTGTSRWVSITSCTGAGGKPRQYFVLYQKTDPSEAQYLHHVLRAWGVSAQGKLVEVPTKAIRCLNDDYGA